MAAARPATVQASAVQLHAIHHGVLQAHEAMTRELGVPELFLRAGHIVRAQASRLQPQGGQWLLHAAGDADGLLGQVAGAPLRPVPAVQ